MRAFTTVLLDGNNVLMCLGKKMSTSDKHYSPQEIQSILEEHEPGVRGKGLKALAKRHNIKGGHNLVKYWLSKWDGTLKSLESVSGGDHRSILTDQEKKKYVDQYNEMQQERCSTISGSKEAY